MIKHRLTVDSSLVLTTCNTCCYNCIDYVCICFVRKTRNLFKNIHIVNMMIQSIILIPYIELN